MRGALTPTLPHMNMLVVVLVLLALSALFWMLGMRSFYRRAIG
jgi:hypothetical protein